MSFYSITYYLKEETSSCGCGSKEHDHEHHHHHRDDYEITARIKSLGAWAHCMPTTYLLKTDLTSTEIYDTIKVGLASSDLVFITKVDKEDFHSVIPQLNEWVKA